MMLQRASIRPLSMHRPALGMLELKFRSLLEKDILDIYRLFGLRKGFEYQLVIIDTLEYMADNLAIAEFIDCSQIDLLTICQPA